MDENVCEKCGGKEWIATGNKYKAKMDFNKIYKNKATIAEDVFFVSEFICKKCKKTKKYFPDYMENVYDRGEQSRFVGLPRDIEM